MSVRPTMAALIGRARALVADPAGAEQTFDDRAIQDALDARRRDLRQVALTPRPTFKAGGIAYQDFYADLAPWEDNAVLEGARWQALTAASPDPLRGHWGFAGDQGPVVYATGAVYDLYGACADLLRQWAATLKLAYDFTSAQQQEFKRSQQVKHLLALAAEYDRRAWPETGSLIRGDDDARG